MADDHAWCDGWLDGFIACGSLMAGYRERYDKMRDEYLGRKKRQEDDERIPVSRT